MKGDDQARHSVVTLVERRAGYLEVGKLARHIAAEATARAIELITRHQGRVRAVTADNGSEFPSYPEIEAVTGTLFSFATPHRSRERGKNENTNFRQPVRQALLVRRSASRSIDPSWVASGKTISEVADKLGISADGLETTATRFNTFARKGVDEDFHRGEKKWSTGHPIGREGTINPALGTIDEALFYALELHPSAFASAGLVTNVHGQVLHQRNRPIPGLYAAGNAAAHTEYGVGYQAGHSLTSGMTFAYLAVRHMLEGVGQTAQRRYLRRAERPIGGEAFPSWPVPSTARSGLQCCDHAIATGRVGRGAGRMEVMKRAGGRLLVGLCPRSCTQSDV